MVSRRSKIVNRICGLARYAGVKTGGSSTHAVPVEKTNLAGFRGSTTSLRAIHLKLIPTCRPASFIGTSLRPLAPPGHPAIATLFAAVALPCHGSDHSHKSSIFQRLKDLTDQGSCGIINGTEEHLSPREPGAGESLAGISRMLAVVERWVLNILRAMPQAVSPLTDRHDKESDC